MDAPMTERKWSCGCHEVDGTLYPCTPPPGKMCFNAAQAKAAEPVPEAIAEPEPEEETEAETHDKPRRKSK